MGEQSSYPLKDAFASFVEIDSARKVPRTQKADRRLFDIASHFFTEVRKIYTVQEVRLEDLERFHIWAEAAQKTVKKEAWSHTTLSLNCRLLKKFFRKMMCLGHISKNPAEFWSVPGGSGNMRRAMTESEYAKLLAAAPSWFCPILRFMRLTGARGASIAALEWGHVDFEAKRILLSSRKGGLAKLKLIPIPMFDALEEFLKTEQKLFGFVAQKTPVFWGLHGTRVSAQEIATEGSKLIRKCGLKGVVLYGLRHSIAVDMTTAGISLEVIRQTLGHSSITHTSRYAQSIASPVVADALKKIRKK